MRASSLLAAIIAVVIGGTTASTALAQEVAAPSSAYDRLIDEALSEFDAGHYEEALSAFEQAYKEKPSARALRGVAKALFELRAYVRSLATIDRALASDVDPLPENLRADLEALKARAERFVGQVVIEVAPKHAAIVIDGQPVSERSPSITRTLDVGPHILEVSAPDHEAQSRRFEIHGRETTAISVHLEPVRERLPVLPLPGSAPAATANETRTVPLVLALGAVVLSTGAVVASSIWLVDRKDAVDRCNDAAGLGARCANEGSIEFQQNAATGTVVLSAGALVVSGVALWFALRGDHRSTPKTALGW